MLLLIVLIAVVAAGAVGFLVLVRRRHQKTSQRRKSQLERDLGVQVPQIVENELYSPGGTSARAPANFNPAYATRASSTGGGVTPLYLEPGQSIADVNYLQVESSAPDNGPQYAGPGRVVKKIAGFEGEGGYYSTIDDDIHGGGPNA